MYEENELGVGIIHFPQGRPRDTQKLTGPEHRLCGHECATCGRCHNAYCSRRTVMCVSAIDAIMYRPSVPEDKPCKKFFGFLKK